MASTEFDAIVLGGGPGGYVCAIRLAQLGVNSLCVEREEFGGVCLNWGCIPSKALIANAHTFEKIKHGSASGIIVAEPKLDVAKMQEWKNGIVKKLTGGVRGLIKGNGSEHVYGTAQITGKNT